MNVYENPTKVNDLGIPPFQETSILWAKNSQKISAIYWSVIFLTSPDEARESVRQRPCWPWLQQTGYCIWLCCDWSMSVCLRNSDLSKQNWYFTSINWEYVDIFLRKSGILLPQFMNTLLATETFWTFGNLGYSFSDQPMAVVHCWIRCVSKGIRWSIYFLFRDSSPNIGKQATNEGPQGLNMSQHVSTLDRDHAGRIARARAGADG